MKAKLVKTVSFVRQNPLFGTRLALQVATMALAIYQLKAINDQLKIDLQDESLR